MGVSVVFEDRSEAVEVVPGEEAVCVLRLENTGMVVDRVLLDVLGDTADWAHVEPAQVNLLPGAAVQVRIAFRPPRTASLAPGEVRFGLRAMSTEDPEGSRIEEGTVRVGEFGDLGTQLVPKSSTGRRSARFKLVVENRGNRPERIRVDTLDPENRLGFRTKPAVFVAPPGTATFVRLKAVPRRTFLKGPNRTLPFEVSALPERGEAAKAEGVMLEKQTLPEWLLPLLGIAVVACGLLFALWFTVLKPVVHSAASEAANAQNAAGSAKSAADAAASAMASAKASPASSATPAAPTALVVKLASPTVVAGTTEPAMVTGTFAQGTGALPKVVWTSSAPNVARVAPDGTVTGLSPGTATITATGVTSTASPAADAPSPAASASPADALSSAAPASPADQAVPAGSVQVTVVGPVSVTTAVLPEAALGKAYSQALGGTGGTGSYTWSVSSGSLPPGLSLSPDTGIISGTPTVAGRTSLTLHLADATTPGLFATKALDLTVVDALAVQSSSLPGATTGTAYSQTLTAVQGTAPFRWSLAPGQGTLPDGLSLDPATGAISGTPSTAGTFNLTAQVTDSANPSQTATQHLSLTVAQPLQISTLTLPDAVTAAPYSQTMNAAGGTEPYTWSISSGALPKGLTLDAASGVLSGTPLGAGSATFTVRATDAGQPGRTADQAYTVRVVTGFAITTSSVPTAAINLSYQTKLTAAGGAEPYVWTPMGTLPPDLSLATDGTISGRPSRTGSFTFSVRSTDSSTPPLTVTQSVTITVVGSLQITTASLPKALTGQSLSQPLTAVGGTAPYTWSVDPTTLPSGLSLNPATGVISGTPTAPGSATITVSVTDAGPPRQATSLGVSLTVVDPLAFHVSAPPTAILGQGYQTATPDVSGGSGQYNWTITGGSLPAGLQLGPAGAISGTVQSSAAAGTYQFSLVVTDRTDATMTKNTQLTIVVVNPLNAPGEYDWSGRAGTQFQWRIQPTGGTGPYGFGWAQTDGKTRSIDGISLDSSTGQLSGTPDWQCTDAVRQPVTEQPATTTCAVQDTGVVTVRDSLGESVPTTVKLTMTVPQLSVRFDTNPPTQTAGSPLSFELTAAEPTGGYGSGTYTYSADGLPCEDTAHCDRIDPTTGTLSGTLDHLDGSPLTFTVTVTSTEPGTGNTITAQYRESIPTAPAPSPTPTPTPTAGGAQ
ncbi:putative Ig domain-containing protein [Kitasatospora sp. NPDC052896]|uniref:putative Ig domain-containing protein n=1 Tax=Kitasatospora sp. NPDC052896 TaxID=3364061 RepID=UPI0037C6EBD1